MGVELTTGGMKAPTNEIDEVLNAGKPAQPNPSAYGRGTKTTVEKSVDGGGVKANSGFTEAKGGSHATPPPGAALSFNAPKWGQLSQDQDAKPAEKTLGQKVKDVADAALDVAVDIIMTLKGPPLGGEGVGLLRGPQLVKEVTGDATDLLRGVEGVTTGGNQVKKAKELLVDPKGMVDPDAGGGTGDPDDASAEDIARTTKVHFGSVEHGVNPDLGLAIVR